MITATLGRIRGRDDRCPEQTLTCDDPLEALDHLVSAELAYGAQIPCVTDRCVTVQTHVFGSFDTTMYAGPADEMRPLVDVATLTRAIDDQHRDTIMDAALARADRIRMAGHRATTYLAMLAPVWLGTARLTVLTMLVCGLTTRDDLEAGSRATLSDVIAALQLARDGSCTFREALAL